METIMPYHTVTLRFYLLLEPLNSIIVTHHFISFCLILGLILGNSASWQPCFLIVVDMKMALELASQPVYHRRGA